MKLIADCRMRSAELAVMQRITRLPHCHLASPRSAWGRNPHRSAGFAHGGRNKPCAVPAGTAVNASCRNSCYSFRPTNPPVPRPLSPVSHSSQRRVASRLGVTLIELLIAVAIIATLSAIFLGASRSAMESARAARTKTTISKLHTLLMQQYASYMTRTVDIDKTFTRKLDDMLRNNVIDSAEHRNMTQDLRLLARRELMKYEMPDRWSDVTEQPRFLANFRRPAITQIYDRRYLKSLNATDADTVVRLDNAETLYLVIMLLTGDGEARTLFSPQDIGDIDEDGSPEFLDGWGNPIAWVRWPAGFVSRSSLITGDTVNDHDPFDPFKRNFVSAQPSSNNYPNSIPILKSFVTHLRLGSIGSLPAPGFRLVPLIYSSGPDGISDIDTSATDTTADPAGNIALDPYAVETGGNGSFQFGTPQDADGDGDNSIDNITNHMIDNR